MCLAATTALIMISAASSLPTPTPAQYVWHEQERIMFVCIDPCTWQNREYDDHSLDLKEMTLPDLDANQWCEAALAWGAKQILFVAKHTGGFCWWQTGTTDYSVMSIPWKNGKGNLVEELAIACKAHGLNMGIYVYPGDASWGAGIGSGGRTKDPAKQEAYNGVFRTQLREAIEIASKHVPVTEIWFDGSCVIEVGDVLAECAPSAVVFQGPHASIRWVGNERGRLDPDKAWTTLSEVHRATGGATAEHSDPDGDAWAPLELDTTLYDHNWFWGEGNETKRKSLDELMHVYYQSAGQGAVMLLNSTPNTQGRIPEGDVAMYRALGAEIDRRFAHPIARTSGRGDVLELDFGRATLVNHAVIMEDYWFGERIRTFVIQGANADGTWTVLAEGQHVGRKHILWFDDAVVSKLCLRITASAATPLIRDFSAYCVTDFRPAPDAPMRAPWAECGSWRAADFEGQRLVLTVDLTPFITEASQWQVEFRQSDGQQALVVKDEVLLQSGQASAPGMLERVSEGENRFNVNRTAVITEEADIKLRVTLDGESAGGVVLIRRQ